MVIYKWLDLHSAYILPIIYRKGQAVLFIRVLHNPYTGVSGSAPARVWRCMRGAMTPLRVGSWEVEAVPSRQKGGSGDACTHTKLWDDKKRQWMDSRYAVFPAQVFLPFRCFHFTSTGNTMAPIYKQNSQNIHTENTLILPFKPVELWSIKACSLEVFFAQFNKQLMCILADENSFAE